ncbi:complement C1q tumor necrosis factor-related protein 3-like [Macrobrachium rosenbergii]|uniref:complement C1q tumor necrosis factor-related protein 3-like n=1 Tax=Macrobrachium rosenbergii TaxID=79674 RepID=UPI0034D532AE
MATDARLLCVLAVICLAGSVTSQNLHSSAPPSERCRGGFTVRKADIRSVRDGGKLAFQEILTNMGGWSQQTSTFEAPCSGAYFFTFHAVSPENGDFTLALMKGPDYQVTAYGSKGAYEQGSNSAVLFLNKGETVHLELQQGSLYEHPFNEAYTTFTGFLIEAY